MDSLNKNSKTITLEEFRNMETKLHSDATGELNNLLRDFTLAIKRINVEVNKAGLLDVIGTSGYTNVQSEEVMKLDVIANNHILNVLKNGYSCAGVASEEMDEIEVFNNPVNNQSKYILLFDPIDGSSNIDTNVSIGSIFSIYRRTSIPAPENPCNLNDFLQSGNKIVVAGYVIYGSSTIFVLATNRGVNGFTLDPTIGEFCLSHPNIICPPSGKIISFNHANYPNFSNELKEKIKQLTNFDNVNYTHRYIGSLVADLHRNLIKGGIFLYPKTLEYPNGKLRLQYECNPMSFIYKIADGKANDEVQNILDIIPNQLHQRVPLIIGSKHFFKP